MRQVLIAGRYRLLDLVGRGGMGTVWRARDEVLHREVAAKQVVPPAWLTGGERDEVRDRTLREARTAARLSHPGVVRVYDVVRHGDSPWIVMEYVPSRTLQDLLDSDGPLAPRRAAEIGLALLAALHAAHTAGVLHRDVKPQNVLVAHDGRIMLTDFGLAVFDGGDGVMTRPGVVLGSPQYVAPERAAEGVSSVAADLWSLGATLHAAVEGRSPYARSTAMATLSALASAPPDPAPHAGPLAPVLAGLLRRDPRHRTGHAETRRRLEGAVGPPAPRPVDDDATLVVPRATSGPDAPTDPIGVRPPTGPSPHAGTATPDAPTDPVGVRPPRRPGAVAPDAPTDPVGVPAPRRRDLSPPERWVSAPAQVDAPGGGHGVAGARRSVATPAGGEAPRPPAATRPWTMVAVSLLVAVAAGVGSAIAVLGATGDEPDAPQGSANLPALSPGDGGPPGDPRVTTADDRWAGDPGRPPRPGPGGPLPPPPFPCVRPVIRGEPVSAAEPAAGEQFRLPRGWAWHADATGFRVAVPVGWRYSRDGDVACFQDPVTGRALSVAGSGDTTAGALTRLRAARKRALDAGALPGYREVRLAQVGDAAEWECEWTTPHGGRLRAAQIVPNRPARTRSWTLGWIARDADWSASTRQLSTVRASFRPGR
ncbi:Serine/threonine protein kinase [Micromonospora nigra]|uniref:non-specific serine/threonine protein kinase n=1 Tax=Micromonospora nigra TaxID=145857 RepID=A0A1C6RDM0_9ACTN|nr:serine/threonine-protein kinase [Micromonospora nigra]SCL15252.1 Serine/threonine protein kinase [Micromonospora nigra]